MVLRVQKIGDEYGVIFPAEALEALRLSDGVEVEVRPVDAATENRYATVEEGLMPFDGRSISIGTRMKN